MSYFKWVNEKSILLSTAPASGGIWALM